jgi:putative sterol carrier protein/FMN-dependent NADH-azoreductase
MHDLHPMTLIGAGIYFTLFLVAALPPLLGFKPFTALMSRSRYPASVAVSPLFVKVNLIINYMWALVFAAAFGLTFVHYSQHQLTQLVMQNLAPALLQLAVALPLTVFLTRRLPQLLRTPPIRFATNREMFAALPFGLNQKKAQGIDTVIQFHLSGDEQISGQLTIRDRACSFAEGATGEADTIITSDSKLWLDITNGDVSGNKAYLEKEYTVQGEQAILLKLNDLFNNDPAPWLSEDDPRPAASPPFAYSSFAPGKIKKILAINASQRSGKYSKSMLMAHNFLKGAEAAGADVEQVMLKGKKISYCQCCYTCWTKTPGVCIYRDDMPELLGKVRDADLIVYITPLYVYSVAAPLKVFLDRLLPIIEPYMMTTEGLVHHPARYKQDPEQGFIVFSAGGFPEVEHNFSGISAIMRNLSSHSEKMRLMAEFYLPASELLSMPVYQERRQRVEQACHDAGKSAVEQGTVPNDLMEMVSDPCVTQEAFIQTANTFWETMDGKKAYLKEMPSLQEERK